MFELTLLQKLIATLGVLAAGLATVLVLRVLRQSRLEGRRDFEKRWQRLEPVLSKVGGPRYLHPAATVETVFGLYFGLAVIAVIWFESIWMGGAVLLLPALHLAVLALRDRLASFRLGVRRRQSELDESASGRIDPPLA